MHSEKQKIKWSDLVLGMGVGVAFLVPGVSAGTLAIIFNLYDKMVNSVNNLFKQFTTSIKILLPILLGIVISILICWYPFKLALEHLLFATLTLFAGFVLGSLPSFVKEIKVEKIKKMNLLLLLLGFLFAAGLGFLSVFLQLDIQYLYDTRPWWLYLLVVFVGIIPGLALVVPGTSGSMMLVVLGFYKPNINMITNFLNWTNIGSTIGLYACLMLGIVVGVLLASKLMSHVLAKHRVATFYVTIGIVLGSLVAMYFNFDVVTYYKEIGFRWWEVLLAGVFLAVGVALSMKISKLGNKIETKEVN